MKPSFAAAALERSMTRPLMKGPRSLMRTTTVLPLRRLVTFTFVPKGRLRWAAVNAAGFIRSPDAGLDVSAYHEAPPHCADAVPADASTHKATAGARRARRKSFCIEDTPLQPTHNFCG